MALIVQKFGGSSLGSIEKIQQVANRIIEMRMQGHALVVVVSAMEGETNRLLSLANTLHDQADARELDALLATGEQISSALLAIALLARGCPARSYTGYSVPIYTDNHHQKARILHIDDTALKKDITEGRVPIIAGFQGISAEGNLTTLGRGGSDTTAAALAGILRAEECHIYTDVEGVYTADPHVVSTAKRLDQVSSSEMEELARAGAKVLQHRAVELVEKYRIPLRVLSSFHNGGSTIIQPDKPEVVESAMVTGVTASRNEAMLSIKGLTPNKQALARFFFLLKELNVEIDMLTQQHTAQNAMDYTFTLARTNYLQVENRLRSLIKEGYVQAITGDPSVSKLTIVGRGLHSDPEIIHTLFHALGAEDIAIMLMLSAGLRVSLIVSEHKVVHGVQVLHHAFNLDKKLAFLA